MNGTTHPAYAPRLRQQIVELYAGGRNRSELAEEFGRSEATIRA